MALSSSPWWDPKKSGSGSDSPPHIRLVPLVQSMQRAQAQRYENMRRMISVYEYGFGASASGYVGPIDDRALHFNPAKNAIDTMHAQVCTPRITPMIMTEGGTRAQRERAKMATRALEGILDEACFDEIQEDVVLDGMLSYCGFVQVFSVVTGDEGAETAEIKVERVIPEDVFVDDAEARDRAPRCLYRRRMRDRYVALAEYGQADPDLYGSKADRVKALKKAKSGRGTAGEYGLQESDQIAIWEAWHLPSGAVDADHRHDGLHVIAVEGGTLLSEPWDRDTFPVMEYRPEKARQGYWGLAVMRQAMAGQREYERITVKLQKAHRMMGSSSLVSYGNAGKLNPREMANGQGQLIECEGPPGSIQELTPTPANPQTYQYREGIADDILRYMGLSAMSSQSEIPAGMQQASGKALQKFEDTESKRGIVRHRTRERLVVGVAHLILDEARALLKDGVRIESRFQDKASFQKIDWKDIVDVLDDKRQYVVKILPVGMLDKTPAARFAQLDVLLERQVITTDQYKRMADLPDISAENDIDTADVDIIDKNLDHMVTTGRYLAPQPFDNLALCVSRGGKYYNAMRIADVPDARLELIRRFVTDANALAMPPEPPPADPLPAVVPADPMGAPPPMADPMANGGAPPMPPPDMPMPPPMGGMQ